MHPYQRNLTLEPNEHVLLFARENCPGATYLCWALLFVGVVLVVFAIYSIITAFVPLLPWICMSLTLAASLFAFVALALMGLNDSWIAVTNRRVIAICCGAPKDRYSSLESLSAEIEGGKLRIQKSFDDFVLVRVEMPKNGKEIVNRAVALAVEREAADRSSKAQAAAAISPKNFLLNSTPLLAMDSITANSNFFPLKEERREDFRHEDFGSKALGRFRQLDQTEKEVDVGWIKDLVKGIDFSQIKDVSGEFDLDQQQDDEGSCADWKKEIVREPYVDKSQNNEVIKEPDAEWKKEVVRELDNDRSKEVVKESNVDWNKKMVRKPDVDRSDETIGGAASNDSQAKQQNDEKQESPRIQKRHRKNNSTDLGSLPDYTFGLD